MNLKEKDSRHQIDMLNGPLLKKILMFALPLAASSILQQLFNSADIAVVGRFADSQALAAVGSNGAVISLLINLFVGLSVGANVIISNYIGQQSKAKAQAAVHTLIAVAMASGIILLVLGVCVAKPILELMNTPEDVIDLATLYLRIYFLGMPFLMLYNFGSAILRSIGDTKRPFYCLVVSGLVNVCLNLLLVIVFNMSVEGVAISTLVSNCISSIAVIYFLCHEKNESIHLDLKKICFNKTIFIKIFKIGAPAGLQGMVFSVSNICIQSAVNGFGSDAVAGVAAALNFEYFCYFVINAFAQATVTFTSQNYGAGKYRRCKKIFRLSMISGCIICGIMSITFVLGSSFFVQLYTTDSTVIQYAVTRMVIVLTLEFLTGTYEISGAALRGIGYSLLPALLTLLGSCGVRLLWVFTIFTMFNSYDMLLIIYPISWVITGTAVLTAYYKIRKKVFNKPVKI